MDTLVNPGNALTGAVGAGTVERPAPNTFLSDAYFLWAHFREGGRDRSDIRFETETGIYGRSLFQNYF